MKSFKICLLFVVLVCFGELVQSQDEAPKRNNLLLRRQGNRSNIFSKAATTTTTAAPQEYQDEGEFSEDEQNYDDDGELDGGEREDQQAEVSTTTTTTEAPNRIGPKIRPFRSNEDLLQALKRRQQSAKLGKKEATPPKQEEQVHDRSSAEKVDKPAVVAAPAPKPQPIQANRRRFGGPGGPKSTNSAAPVQEQQAQSVEENSAVPRRPAGRARFLTTGN